MNDKTSSADTQQPTTRLGPWPLILALLAWVAIAWFAWYRYQPPAVVSADADPARFSAERAEVFLERLYRNAEPHPAGNNDEFRQQLIREFEQLGYSVELHRCQSASRNRRAPRDKLISLANMIIRLEGKSSRQPVMLAAHYDSVPDSPGAADDGSAVCVVLEIARMLASEPQPERTIIFFLSDGEEFGLLGARKFVEEHTLSGQIAAVINLEARGTSGPSLLFETSENSRWLVNLFARCSRRPFTSSLFYEIYKTLPNNTDFTVFRDHGMQGLNFAFIGDVRHYHTPDDNFENVNRRSIQHHGEHALELVRQLSHMEIENQRGGRAVYFDVMGMGVVRWPAELSIALAVLGGLLSIWLFRPGSGDESAAGFSRGSRILGNGLGLLGLLICIGAGLLLQFGLSLDGALDSPWPNWPLPLILSWWLLGLVVLLGLGWWLADRIGWQDVWLGVWGLWATVAVVSSVLLNGASYLWIVPLLITGVFALLATLFGQPRWSIVAVLVSSTLAVAIIWLPMEPLFYDAVGFNLNSVLIGRVALSLLAFLPLIVATNRRVVSVLLLVALAAWVVSVMASVIMN
ncbi:MAG: M28 family peptidase [Pirellulaceae bacterium]